MDFQSSVHGFFLLCSHRLKAVDNKISVTLMSYNGAELNKGRVNTDEADFCTFFSLGLVSFGGPAAHIGYFRKTFVEELGWLDDKDYASLVALSQFLPGPGSSQVGFAIGYRRGALPGAILAFIGFTLPSFLLMFLLAVSSYQYLSSDLFQGLSPDSSYWLWWWSPMLPGVCSNSFAAAISPRCWPC